MKNAHSHWTQAGKLLHIDHYPANHPSSNAILYIHGFKGFKDWGFVPYIGNQMAGKGYHFFAFNFSHNGIGDSDFTEFTQPEKFKRNTFSLEVSEAVEMIELLKNGFVYLPPMEKIAVIGHSRGGGIALLAACNHPAVDAIVTWASVSTFQRYGPEVVRKWKEMGYLEVANARTGQIFHLGRGLLTDVEVNGATTLNIRAAVEQCTKPLCLIHGATDEAVPADEAQYLYEWADQTDAELHLIPGAGHTFGTVHPFAGTTEDLENVLRFTADFFQGQL